jgi:Rieske Fe-S protein
MDRKEFIKTCGLTCLCAASLPVLIQGCSALMMIPGKIEGDELVVELVNFEDNAGNEIFFRKYIVIQNELLKFPVCVYRLNENEYTALWMRCTHQGNELRAFGDKLQCPAHGSEFDNRGGVQNGPAEKELRTFPVIIERDLIRISLKAI